MIAYNCVFLSFYFILTFPTIKSTKKVSPTYYASRKFSSFYVNTVTNLKTYNEREIIFSEKEIRILTSPVQTYIDTKGRDEVFDKFDTKDLDIKCTCSLIVKTQLGYLTNILEGLRSGGAIEVANDKLTELKKDAGLMVLFFQESKVKAAKWFWSYFFKIIAIIDYESNKHFFRNIPFAEEELQSGISHFIQYCKNYKYLSKKRTETDLVSNNLNVPINIFKTLRASIIVAIDYYMIEYKPIDYFYLKQLWNEHEFLFSQITGSNIEWRPTIRRFAVEVNKTKEYVENRQWILKPFGHLSYHKLIKQIISVRTYIFLWVTFEIFNKEMPKLDVDSLKTIYSVTMDTIVIAQEFMPYTDTFFSDLVGTFHCVMNEDAKNFDSIISGISVRVKEILIELNGCNSNENDWISIDINEEFTTDMIMSFLREFSDNFCLLKNKITTLNYELALSLLGEDN